MHKESIHCYATYYYYNLVEKRIFYKIETTNILESDRL